MQMILHVHQSFKERFFWVGLMVPFAISFHSLAWLRRGLVTTWQQRDGMNANVIARSPKLQEAVLWGWLDGSLCNFIPFIGLVTTRLGYDKG